MKRVLCLLCALAALLSCTAALAEADVVYWTTAENPYYHLDAACGGMEGAVRLSAGAAEAFGKLPCPTCVEGGAGVPVEINAFEDTSFYGGTVRLRPTATGWEEMSLPALAGEWIYYVKTGYRYEGVDSWGDPMGEYAYLCRCRTDLSGEEVLLESDAVGQISGIRDAGDGILFWYSDIIYTGEGYTTVRFMKMDYDGGEPQVFAECPIKGAQRVSNLTIAEDTAWFSWFDFDLDISREGATGELLFAIGEIYELPLRGERAEAKPVLSERRMVYDVTYAYGRLFFMDNDDDGLYYCALDPDTGARKVLLHLDPGAAPGGAPGGRFTIVGGRFYAWDDDRKATVSMKPDGSDVKVVSKDRFGFSQVWKGSVLAAKLIDDGVMSIWYADGFACVYHPADADNPAFDPDNADASPVGYYDFILGDRLYAHDAGAPNDHTDGRLVVRDIP